jgi:hypothetical protein
VVEQGVFLLLVPDALGFDHQLAAGVKLLRQFHPQRHPPIRLHRLAALQHRPMRGDVHQIADELIAVLVEHPKISVDDLTLFASCLCHYHSPVSFDAA